MIKRYRLPKIVTCPYCDRNFIRATFRSASSVRLKCPYCKEYFKIGEVQAFHFCSPTKERVFDMEEYRDGIEQRMKKAAL